MFLLLRREPPSEADIIKTQVAYGRIVEIVESGEGIKRSFTFCLPAGRTEIGSNEPVAIHRVKRESIDVDEDGHQQPEGHYGRRESEQQPPRSIVQNLIVTPWIASDSQAGLHGTVKMVQVHVVVMREQI